MERMRRIADLWNWLPAFRAVAETQHLPTASEKLHVSPSALSRTIRLLEDAVGSPLFDRVGRELRLNANGEALLAATRDAMRLVDGGLAVIDDAQFVGPVHISAVGTLSLYFVLPALDAIRRTHDKLIPHLYNHGARVAHPRLLRGEIDIAFHDDEVANEELEVEQIGEATKGIYCGHRHPLFRAQGVRVEDVLEHDFAAPTQTLAGGTPDGWPSHMRRKIGFYVTDLHIGMRLVEEGRFLAVLPDVGCQPLVELGRMRRLPVDVVPPVKLFASRRKLLGPPGRAEVVLEAVKARVADESGRVGASGSPLASEPVG